ncbi:MAG: hypothetical protein PUC12_10180 [Clostridiales bacterium]|nr:hypothetical protein [Clostridiales bacterium]
MKIDSGTINMDSGRSYIQSTEITSNITAQNAGGIGSYQSSTSFRQTFAQYSGTAASRQYDAYEPSNDMAEDTTPLASDLYTNMSGTAVSLFDVRSTLEDFRQQLIERLEQFMEQIRKQLLGLGNSQSQFESILGGNYSASYTKTSPTGSSIVDLTTSTSQPGSLWNIQTSSTVKKSEEETTTFNSKGTVQTADGRSIDFQISMEMSHSFVEESTMLSSQTQYILTDPLVIQLEDAPDTISDQKWFFDIDGDGTKEEISELAKGNGFLALDEDENGIIDDGSELFGTKSGNGFKDLAAYDEDGNGWIDENDTVYSKLKIWTKDAEGNDKLMDLQQADIGAIYLGHADTEFTHKSLDTNETQAVVRQTGFYLHESTGAAGTIQQIDFATNKSA